MSNEWYMADEWYMRDKWYVRDAFKYMRSRARDLHARLPPCDWQGSGVLECCLLLHRLFFLKAGAAILNYK